MARYSVLRLMIFFGFLCALWLLGLRDESERLWLLAFSALGSMVVSYFVLQGPRAELSAKIARHVDERAGRAEARQSEIDEDTGADEDTPRA
jgi:C4-dicarboxylate-specific signal transduction histidine kinase